MSNYIEYNNRVAFHPGYYIKEIIDDSKLTQEDFAKRLGTTPKNLSLLIRGKQKLSPEMAVKLSALLKTSIEYWLNLQTSFDSLIAEFESEKELEKETNILKTLSYQYFVKHFHLPKLSRQIKEQAIHLREFLQISSLTLLTNETTAINFRSASPNLSPSNIIKANSMVQLAINKALTIDAPKYDATRFKKAIACALTLTEDTNNFFPLLEQSFLDAGVILVALPHLSGSKINGATKKIGNHILLMISDRNLRLDTFWFTLFHEIGHIINGDFGVSLEQETGEKEERADRFARDSLIPPENYKHFRDANTFTMPTILNFAKSINRNPSIVIGRLQYDKLINYEDPTFQKLLPKFKIVHN